MMHGIPAKMELTHESVAEAIEEWLQRHMLATVPVKLSKWVATANTYGDTQTISIEFVQAVAGEPHG